MRNAPTAAVLVPVDMNAVTGVGAPWYTSGVHMWKGTAEALNPRATATSAMAAMSSGCDVSGPACESFSPIAASDVVPAMP